MCARGPCSHGCGLFDAVEADPGGGGGDGHGSGHTHAEAVVVLPAVPSLPDGRTHLRFRGGELKRQRLTHVKEKKKKNFQDYSASSPAEGIIEGRRFLKAVHQREHMKSLDVIFNGFIYRHILKHCVCVQRTWSKKTRNRSKGRNENRKKSIICYLKSDVNG